MARSPRFVRWSVLAVVVVGVVAGLPLRATGQDRSSINPLLLAYPEIIVHNGRVVSLDDKTTAPKVGTIVQAMAVRNGTIIAMGANDAVLALKGDKTIVVDLKGRTVLPGLIDAHSHFHDYAGAHWGLPGVPPPIVVRSEDPEMLIKGVREGVGEREKNQAPGSWIHVSLLSKLCMSTIR